MKRTITVIAFALLACTALGAGAQEKEPGVNDVTEYIFNDVSVTGTIIGPDGKDIIVRRPAKTKSLIKVRSNFVHAMLKSVEDI